jgi:excisionase family DNA binding protein
MRWMKVDEACRHAGNVSRKTLYGAVRARRLKAARVGSGRNLLFAAEWLDDWLRSSSEEGVTIIPSATRPNSSSGAL